LKANPSLCRIHIHIHIHILGTHPYPYAQMMTICTGDPLSLHAIAAQHYKATHPESGSIAIPTHPDNESTS